MPTQLFVVDAFTDRPFAGNPAAVCILDEAVDASWAQAVAAEMNFAESAFVVPRDDGFDLRWFTPTVEMDLCGHATLAAAHALWEEGRLKETEPARFHTRSGLLVCERSDTAIRMDFPADPPLAEELDGADAAVGAPVLWTGRSNAGWVVEVPSEDIVRRLEPDMALIASIPGQGVIVTARASTAGFDFVSRYFAPAIGIAEDPVTGASHCALAPYWAERLGGDELIGYQASARGGVIGVRVMGDRIRLTGNAVTVSRGELLV